MLCSVPKLSLTDFRASILPPEEIITGRLGYVHDLFLTFDYEVVDTLPEAKGDFVVIMDNKDHPARLRRLGHHDGKIVVVAAGSDGAFSRGLLPHRQLPANVAALFTINAEVDDPRVIGVPLGVRIERAELVHRALTQRTNVRKSLLYANFSCGPLYPRRNGRPHIRHLLANRLRGTDWLHLNMAKSARPSDATRLAYYANMARHEFALSPEGFGADCYRHWECLYFGTIPIIQAGPVMSRFSDLPILFTKDYTEVDPLYLQAQRERFAARHFELEKLTVSFYKTLFQERVHTLSDPRFLCWGFRGTNDEAFLDRLGTATHN
jgi:hypothetical protein